MVFELFRFLICLFDLFLKFLLIVILCAADACVISFTLISAFHSEPLSDNESIAVGTDHAVRVDFVAGASSAEQSLILRDRELSSLAPVNAHELSKDRTRCQKLKDYRKDQNCTVTPAELHL